MAHIHRSTAALRVIGDTLQPDEITQMLGCAPSYSHSKGHISVCKESGNTYVKDFGIWSLYANDCEPENLDEQVRWLLSQLTPDLTIWATIRERYRIDIFCGLFMEEKGEGLIVSPKILLALGERGIEFDLCIYAPISEADS